jgi:hypothetical protein
LDVTKGDGPDEGRLRAKSSAFDRFAFYRRLVEGWGKLRRFYLAKFRRGYVERMRRTRRGECRRCGSCCSIMFRCPHLKDANHCAIYVKRYRQCDDYPIDHRDLRYREDVCGHYFVRE